MSLRYIQAVKEDNGFKLPSSNASASLQAARELDMHGAWTAGMNVSFQVLL